MAGCCAETTGCKIRAYNLSVEQLKYARDKAKRHGVDHLVQFIEADYRSATGPVDKVVSIGCALIYSRSKTICS